MGVPGKTVGVMFTPLSVKYKYYDTERIGGKNLNSSFLVFCPANDSLSQLFQVWTWFYLLSHVFLLGWGNP